MNSWVKVHPTRQATLIATSFVPRSPTRDRDVVLGQPWRRINVLLVKSTQFLPRQQARSCASSSECPDAQSRRLVDYCEPGGDETRRASVSVWEARSRLMFWRARTSVDKSIDPASV